MEWVLIKDFPQVLVAIFRHEFQRSYLCGANIDWVRSEAAPLSALPPRVIYQENKNFIYNLDIYFCSIFLCLFIHL